MHDFVYRLVGADHVASCPFETMRLAAERHGFRALCKHTGGIATADKAGAPQQWAFILAIRIGADTPCDPVGFASFLRDELKLDGQLASNGEYKVAIGQ
jgi:hypothetical protein